MTNALVNAPILGTLLRLGGDRILSLEEPAAAAARVGWPVLAGTARLVVVVAGGMAAVALGAPLSALYAVIAFGIAVWGGSTIVAVRASDWSRR